jgi:hypothetical protein
MAKQFIVGFDLRNLKLRSQFQRAGCRISMARSGRAMAHSVVCVQTTQKTGGRTVRHRPKHRVGRFFR